jgi:hypothetical protein
MLEVNTMCIRNFIAPIIVAKPDVLCTIRIIQAVNSSPEPIMKPYTLTVRVSAIIANEDFVLPLVKRPERILPTLDARTMGIRHIIKGI